MISKGEALAIAKKAQRHNNQQALVLIIGSLSKQIEDSAKEGKTDLSTPLNNTTEELRDLVRNDLIDAGYRVSFSAADHSDIDITINWR